ncbi:uncharacterized protein LOC114455410 isoform X2 [Gouania willdenowi]|uniref:uncharacterized protein LOC114455410 isoform X2 n=1 Tax=Gouania willdenowi TaxID=441366 RepID=UPI001056452C|nr:uncharacterized protein LOC114455410 isoform X2 [Gouania willdenowi]
MILTDVFAAEKQIEISTVVGSSVTLHCANDSTGDLTGVTWRTDNSTIFTYVPDKNSNVLPIADFNRKMFLSESELYALVIDNVQKSDAKNYTCEINTNKGLWELRYEVIVKDEDGRKVDFLIPVFATVPFVFFLMLVLAWILLRKCCKKHKENDVVSPGTGQDADCVYENYLEGEKRVQAVMMINADHSEIRGNYY